MIKTKKNISVFYESYSDIEEAIRSKSVPLKKRKLEISHEKIPDLSLNQANENDSQIYRATKHLNDLGMSFSNPIAEDIKFTKDPQALHKEKVSKKQHEIIAVFLNDLSSGKDIAKKLRVSADLVYFTLKNYKITNSIVPYTKYKCTRIDKRPIIKQFFKENPESVGISSKAIQQKLQITHSRKFGLKLIKKTLLSIGMTYSNWAWMSRRSFSGKGNLRLEKEKILEIFNQIENGVKQIFQDEIKFFSKQQGSRYWCNRKQFNEKEKSLKGAKIEKKEVIVAYSLDGLEGIMQMDSACTGNEYRYFIESMLQREYFTEEPFVIFEDVIANP